MRKHCLNCGTMRHHLASGDYCPTCAEYEREIAAKDKEIAKLERLLAKERWNATADEFNQWDGISLLEQEEAIKALREGECIFDDCRTNTGNEADTYCSACREAVTTVKPGYDLAQRILERAKTEEAGDHE